MINVISQERGSVLISQIMKRVHLPHWTRKMPTGWDPNIPVLYYEETNYHGMPYNVPVIVLRTNPCLWFVQGGCVMCNYMIEASNSKNIGRQNILNQIQWVTSKFENLSKFPYVVVTTAGSFLSPYEIDDTTRIDVLHKLRNARLKTLAFESEAKYCTDLAKLETIKEVFRGDIGIGIGLESSNSYIRNVCLNKGLSEEILNKSSKLLKRVNIGFYYYILLGKPFLSPNDDIIDAVNSIKFAIDAGAYMVVLLLVNIQPFTLTHWLWQRNMYKSPSLWRAIHVLELLPEKYRIRVAIKGIEHVEPSPIELSQGCSKCSDLVSSALRQWNYDRNFKDLRDRVNKCDCYNVEPNLNLNLNKEYKIEISTNIEKLKNELLIK